jgi:uncharacterized membrane protein
MNYTSVLLLAFAIGVIAGLRSMTAPAAVSWAAHVNWLNLHNSRFSILGSTAAAYILTILALGELVSDKLPSTPNRTTLMPLVGRGLTGALAGAALCASANQSIGAGAVLGLVGAVAGAFAGYEVRHRIVQRLHVPDFLIAIAEDLVAIGGGFFIVTRLG